MKRISNEPKHHFFGYYDLCPWDASGRYHLSHETSFHDRIPDAKDAAAVGVIDARDGSFQRFGETRAFNLQQGAMMHWIDAGFGEELTYNDWEGDRLVTRAVQMQSHETRTLEGAVAAVSSCGSRAIGLDYARIYALIRHYGYAHTAFTRDDLDPAPANDGFFAMDLRSGQCELMLSIADVRAALAWPGAENAPHYFCHVAFSPDGERLIFFCRSQPTDGGLHSLWTVRADGSDLRCLIDYSHVVSHFAWMDERRLMISCDVLGEDQFVELRVDTGEVKPMPIEGFPEDGHQAISPDGRWIVCDTYPRGPARECSLFLHDRQRGVTHDLARLAHPEAIRHGWRCDLHPRWSRDGLTITIDSVHEGTRQIYAVDVPD